MTAITRSRALPGASAAPPNDEPIVVMWRESKDLLEEGARFDHLAGEAASRAENRRLDGLREEVDIKAFGLWDKIADTTPEGPRGWAIQARLLEQLLASGRSDDKRDLLIAGRITSYLEGLADAERLTGEARL